MNGVSRMVTGGAGNTKVTNQLRTSGLQSVPTKKPLMYFANSRHSETFAGAPDVLLPEPAFFPKRLHPDPEGGVRLPDRRRARIAFDHIERLMPGLIRDFQRIDAVRRGRRHEPCAHRMAREVAGKPGSRAPARNNPRDGPAAEPFAGLRMPVEPDEQRRAG
jgi:hypothetical protein